MKITRIELSYRLTESAQWNNVQVERRLVAEFPLQAGSTGHPVDSSRLAGWLADDLREVCRRSCERDIDDWLEQHDEPPRYHRGPRYVAWIQTDARVAIVLPLGQKPDPAPNEALYWSPMAPTDGMRLRSVRQRLHKRLAEVHDDWLILATPAAIKRNQVHLTERLAGATPRTSRAHGPWLDDDDATDQQGDDDA